MAFNPTPVNQGSAHEFRETINNNFTEVKDELTYTYTEGQQTKTKSVVQAIADINSDIYDSDDGINARITKVNDNLSDYETLNDSRLNGDEAILNRVKKEVEGSTVQGEEMTGLLDRATSLETSMTNLNKSKVFYNSVAATGSEISFYFYELDNQ